MRCRGFFLVSLVACTPYLFGEEPLKLGNFSLPSWQQPSPLVGFGENIIEEGKVQLFLFADDYRQKGGYFIDCVPSLLYGITDQFSLFFNVPIAVAYKKQSHHSCGFEDLFLQLEYAFYSDSKRCSTTQATIVGNITFPTGSFEKNPSTGYGTPTFFVGATYNCTMIDWFYFGSLGAIFTTPYLWSRSGNQYLYEMGVGRNIATAPGWIFAWMVEFNGWYVERNRVGGVINPNSGGNLLFVTPSLWLSSEHLILQLGAGGVLMQHLFGHQFPYTYQIVGNIGWVF